jgi:hypothetical protein
LYPSLFMHNLTNKTRKGTNRLHKNLKVEAARSATSTFRFLQTID